MQPEATGDTHAARPAEWHFELVPLLELPEVDLSISVKARLPRIQPLIQSVDFLTKHSVPLFFAYLAFLAIATGILFVDAKRGRMLSIVGAVLGLPSLAVCFSMLRYDLVVILIKTYDVWFFGATSTLVAITAGTLFHDERSLFVVVSWLSFFISIFVDANLFAIRNIWITGAISAVCYVILAGTITIGSIDDLQHVNLLNTNGHALPANVIVRDGVGTMVVLILRNLFRRYHHAIKKQRIAVDTSVFIVHCVTFRCRLQYRELQAVRMPEAASAHRSVHRQFLLSATRSPLPRAKTRLRFAPFLGPIDVRHSLIPVDWFWKLDPQKDCWWTRWGQSLFSMLGMMSFFVPNAVILASLLAPSSVDRMGMVVASAGALFGTLVFVTACFVTAHRRLLLALITSFDFVYIAFQGVTIHLTLTDLCGWKPEITLALLSDLVWSTWMMCWDAVPPPARKRLGVTSGFAAYIGTGLVTIIILSACMLVVVLPPRALNDRALVHVYVFGSRLEFFVLTWYLSCAATIVSWAIRIMWRLWRAIDTELVVLDGPVFFEKPFRSREAREKSSKRASVTNIPLTDPTAIFPTTAVER